MRVGFAGVAAICLVAMGLQGQTTNEAPETAASRSYNLLRENDDWSFLSDPANRDDFWDPLKYIPLGSNGSYVSLGGEVREAFEQVGNDNWGKQNYTNTFFLQRYMLHSDWHLGDWFRVFVQLKSGLEDFRAGGARPIDEKKLDFEAAFLEIRNERGKNWAILRLGRQELNYGSGRLVSVREGPNVRQSFDGVKIRSKVGAWNIDEWAVRPDLDNPGFFDNAPDHKTAFWGVYATRPLRHGIAMDIYYLGEDRKTAAFERGVATELRHSLAGRLWRPVAKKEPGLDFDYEGVVQLGTFGSDDVRAWTVATDTGYTLTSLPLRPRFSFKADISSGDNPQSHTLGTFYPVFPLGNYFGVLADTGPGPVNFIDVHPRIQLQLPHSVSASVDFVAQWRENTNDGVYAVPGFLLVAGNSGEGRFVGYRPGTEVRWNIDRHAYLQADYGIFYAGKFLREASPRRNINYLELWAGYKF